MASWNNFYRYAFYLGLLFSFCTGCDTNPAKTEKTKELVFVVNLVNDESKINEYLRYHEKVWPEVEAGFRKAGYREIKMFRFNTTLVMTIRIPENADVNQIGRMAEAYDEKCAEWNQIMSGYQVGVTGTNEGQKWAEAKLFYFFRNE
ncbi:MAG: L-rhamnose mutarotase [Chitinophagaceae bacterium]|nr:L-rhamnose mutarotase [Chitinophagaceae bacterium]